MSEKKVWRTMNLGLTEETLDRIRAVQKSHIVEPSITNIARHMLMLGLEKCERELKKN